MRNTQLYYLSLTRANMLTRVLTKRITTQSLADRLGWFLHVFEHQHASQ